MVPVAAIAFLHVVAATVIAQPSPSAAAPPRTLEKRWRARRSNARSRGRTRSPLTCWGCPGAPTRALLILADLLRALAEVLLRGGTGLCRPTLLCRRAEDDLRAHGAALAAGLRLGVDAVPRALVGCVPCGPCARVAQWARWTDEGLWSAAFSKHSRCVRCFGGLLAVLTARGLRPVVYVSQEDFARGWKHTFLQTRSSQFDTLNEAVRSLPRSLQDEIRELEGLVGELEGALVFVPS